MNRLRVALAAVLVALAALALGCKKGQEQRTLLVAGATGMQGYLKALAEEYAKKNPHVSAVAEGGGSTAGIVALKHGAIDVAAMSRDLTVDEDDISVRNFLLARDGIAIVVATSNPIQGLSLRDARRAFMGEVRSWKELGGNDEPIDVVTREGEQLTRHSLQEILLDGNDVAGTAQVARTWDHMIDAVKANPRAIGYLSLLHQSPAVKVLALDGIAMTRATILSARYPLTRSFYLVVCNPSDEAERFVEFALGKDGQAVLEKDGLIPVY